jgi:hypothetical protein
MNGNAVKLDNLLTSAAKPRADVPERRDKIAG